MDYSDYNTDDFLLDESFINFCYDSNDADKAHWENIIRTQPLLKNKIDRARDLCLMLNIRVSAEEKNKALQKLKASLAAEANLAKPLAITNVRKLWVARLTIAATLLVLLIGYGFYRYHASVPGSVLYSQVTNGNYHIVEQTDNRSRKTLVLPDGTRVLLNGSSTLKIANDYNKDNRHVLLTGEAFFEVTKDKSRPFVVLTSKTATTALGTSFKVSSYNGAKTASVMLSTGKVRVEATQAGSAIKEEILVPGQQVMLTDAANRFTRGDFKPLEIQNWKESRLVFNNADFTEIATKIETTYGTRLKTNGKQADRIRFTGQFSNKSLSEVLDAIGYVNNFTYKYNAGNVTLVF
ncbi:MAG: FecR domain-containing protein [Mucilaginibacter sp.]|nr:FecR domain-containing protein [Mucilaginibacter sp.]